MQTDIFKHWSPSEGYRRQKAVAHSIVADLFAVSLNEKPDGKLAWGISDVSDKQLPYTLTPGHSINAGMALQLQQGPHQAGNEL